MVTAVSFGIKEISIPFFTAVIGYITNWTAVIMLFQPLDYRGFRIPGLKALVPFLPKKVLLVPIGLSQGRFGWQGIVPSRASKMGSIAVDKGLFLLGTPQEFYNELEPDKIAEQIVATSQSEMRGLVEQIMIDNHPALWYAAPPQVREAVHQRVRDQLPGIVKEITRRIGENLDDLLDVKLMVIRKMEERPVLGNMIFFELGRKELKLIQNLGFVFGFVFGIPLMLVTMYFHKWDPITVPILGIFIGFIVNKIALDMIFEPIEPKHILGIKFHGLFLRRQHEVAAIYARIVSEEIVTVANLGEELMNGPRSDRTRRMIEDTLRPAVDGSVGFARTAVRLAGQGASYETIRESFVSQGAEFAIAPMADPEFNRQQGARVEQLLTDKVRRLDYGNFSAMLRTAIHDDEWLVLVHGGALGLLAGGLHLFLFNLLKIAG